MAARRRVELVAAALRESERRLALAASGTRIGMFEWDLTTNQTLWSDQHVRLLGLAPTPATATMSAAAPTLAQAYTYQDWAERVHPHDLPRVEAELRRCLVERIPYESEYRVIWPDDSLHWLVGRGLFVPEAPDRATRMLGIVLDITERREMEEALRRSHLDLELRVQERTTQIQKAYSALMESEREHRTILRTAMDGYCRVDAQGRLIEVNEALSRMTGYTEQELVRLKFADLEAIEPAGALARCFARIRAQGEGRFESRHYRKDGSSFDVEVSAQYRPEGGGHQVVFIRDITERKRAEERMRSFSREVIAAREQERRQVSSALHHDVGSLAVGLAAHLDQVEAELQDRNPKAATRWITRTRRLLEESVARLKELAVQLRPPELDTLGLCPALRQHFSQITQHSGVRIRFRETLGRRRVSGNAAAVLFRIAQEALTNAIRHGQAARVNVNLQLARDALTLTVADDGRGFDPSEPAAKVPSRMGLRVMREMAILAGGDCTVEAASGRGTTVRARLPLEALARSANPGPGTRM